MIIQKHPMPLMIEFLGTPEAGKTTTIHRLAEELSKSKKVSILQESAELVPPIFPKGGLAAHFWMRLNTGKAVLEAEYRKSDIVLIDRGLVDTLFWNYYYSITGSMTPEEAAQINNFFLTLPIHMPDKVFFLYTTPEEAIRRRGGEGRIVTLDFVTKFGDNLRDFIKTVEVPVVQLDTTNLSENTVLENIKENLYV